MTISDPYQRGIVDVILPREAILCIKEILPQGMQPICNCQEDELLVVAHNVFVSHGGRETPLKRGSRIISEASLNNES